MKYNNVEKQKKYFRYSKNNQGFTLVELIVVITILSILGTIAFMSLNGYAVNARDSVRKTDVKNIATSLALFETVAGFYPEPTNVSNITYSGGLAWGQGTIGSSVISNLQKLNKLPVDPLTGSEYTYSRLNTKNQYEIAAVLESGSRQSSPNIDGKILGTAYVRGDYNGLVTKVNTGSITYVLAVPTIISGDVQVTDIISVFGNLITDGGMKLANSYVDSIFDIQADGTSELVQISSYVVFSGNINEFKDENTQLGLITNLQQAYSGTNIRNNSVVTSIFDYNTSIDIEETKLLAQTIINQNINSSVKITADPSIKAPLFESSVVSYYNFDKDYSDGGSIGNNGIAGGNAFIDSTDFHEYRKSYVTFSGTGGHIEVPHNNSYDLLNGTISYWAKVNETSVQRGLFSKDASGTTKNGHISMYSRSNNRFELRIQNISGSSYTIYPNSISVGNDWNHIVTSFGSNGMRFFINGALAGTDAYTGGIDGNQNPIVLGVGGYISVEDQLTPLIDYLTGSIDEVIIYDRQITDSEALDLYNSQK